MPTPPPPPSPPPIPRSLVNWPTYTFLPTNPSPVSDPSPIGKKRKRAEEPIRVTDDESSDDENAGTYDDDYKKLFGHSEVDPEREKSLEKSREALREYNKAFAASDGFDVPKLQHDLSVVDVVVPLKNLDPYLEMLIPCCHRAMNRYNKFHATDYCFKMVEKANLGGGFVQLYYITFVGERNGEENKTFQTLLLDVWPERKKVIKFCRAKGTPSGIEPGDGNGDYDYDYDHDDSDFEHLYDGSD